MATLDKRCLLITASSILLILPLVSSAPVVPDCPYPPFPDSLCSSNEKGQDQLWCSSGITLRVKICETLLSPSEGHRAYDPLMKDFRINASDTSRASVVTEFCGNVTLVRHFLALTLSSSLNSTTELIQPEKCEEICTKSKVCGLTLLSFKFYQDLTASKNEVSVDQVQKTPDPVVLQNPVRKNDKAKPASAEIEDHRDKADFAGHDMNPSSIMRSSSLPPVVDDDEIPIPDNVSVSIPEETPPESKAPADKKTDPVDPPHLVEINQIVKETELKEKQEQDGKGQSKVSTSPSSSSPVPQVAPIPVAVNQNSPSSERSSSSSPAAAGDVHPGAVPPPVINTDAAGGGKSIVPPVGKMSKNDEPLPPEGDNDMSYKEDKIDMDSLGPVEDPGVEEEDNVAGGVEKQRGNVVQVPPENSVVQKTRVDSNELEQKPGHVVHHYSRIPDHGDPYMTELTEESGYFNYFITILGFLFIGFILFHNKKRLLAFLIEGRRPATSGRRGRRRSPSNGGNSSSYRKLENNFD